MTIKIDHMIVDYDVKKVEKRQAEQDQFKRDNDKPRAIKIDSSDVKQSETRPEPSKPVEQQITAVKKSERVESTVKQSADVIHMHERLERPEVLVGSTYKIKMPLSEHAFYITINDVILNQGTEHEQRRPFEIFINSKNMEHFQWIVALTRIISAVFRKGGDVIFLVEELRSVFDPRGGYFKRGGKYMPSLVAELGDVVETHLKHIGLITNDEDGHRDSQELNEKFEVGAASPTSATAQLSETSQESESSDNEVKRNVVSNGKFCDKCHQPTIVKRDGCELCLSCGESKCG